MTLQEMANNRPKGSFYYNRDSPNDFGIYEIGTYEDGKPRYIYRTSVETATEAGRIVRRLNAEELTIEDFVSSQRAKRPREEHEDPNYYLDPDWPMIF